MFSLRPHLVAPTFAPASITPDRPVLQKLRRILEQQQQQQQRGPAGGAAAGGAAPNLSRNSPSERCSGGEKRASGGAGGGGGGAPVAAAAARRKPPSATRARAKDALTVAPGAASSTGRSSSSSPSSSSGGRARTPSPVLSGRRSGQPAERAGIAKSASVPADLRSLGAGLHQRPPPPAPGILKRSGSLLTGLEPRGGLRALLLRRRRPARPAEGAAPGGARKCVSFSADTGRSEEGRPGGPERPRRTAPVHEARVYRKGVLQDRNGGGETSSNLPLSWEESLGGPRALLGAAQDGDDELVKRIVTLANKSGFGNIDINAVDGSGRTAVSYMAGNGSALMLEACVSFHRANANLPDNEGNTPLHFAAQAGQTECLNILLQRCPTIEVDARNSLGFTPLMKAALQGRTKCAKILLFAGANPTLRDHGRGLRAEQWARFCGRYVCADVIERFARHRLLEKTTSCRWGSEPELATQVLQGKLIPVPTTPVQQPSSGFKSKIRRVFRTSSNSDKHNFSLVSQLTSAALCASSPVLPKPGDVSPVVKSLLRPLSVPQLRITLVAPQDMVEKSNEKCSHSTTFTEKIESSIVKPPRTKKKSK